MSEIGESAFSGCERLQKVVFGSPLTKVYGKEPYNGIFNGCTTTDIDLLLSSKQKLMSCSQDGNVWTPSTVDYKESNEYKESKFLED